MSAAFMFAGAHVCRLPKDALNNVFLNSACQLWKDQLKDGKKRSFWSEYWGTRVLNVWLPWTHVFDYNSRCPGT